ncbi:MAG: winged helix-turn-helix transcriptional regulator, partial [Pseudohongiella sp.]|nr:winged helix-turn-helix transcriptional regulator [Pseudohongiella sp.]
LSALILELVRGRGRITISEAIELTGANRGTLKDHFNMLVKKNYLARHGSGRGSWYGLS